MIIIRVELHSAINGSITELARMKISNTGYNHITDTNHNYKCQTFRGINKETLNKETVERYSNINNWPRERYHIWNMVAKALKNMGYNQGQ